MKNKKVTVLGCGTWGSALSQILAENGHQVTAWEFNSKTLEQISKSRSHPHLDGFRFSDSIVFNADLGAAVSDADFIIIAVPSHAVRSVLTEIKNWLNPNVILVNVAKGVENESLLTMSEVIQEVLDLPPEKFVSFSGPSHAEEVIKGMPTTIVSASKSLKSAEAVQHLFSSHLLRVYTNTDIRGVELGGSLKNVIAIAAGICDGIGYGDNTKAALLTRGIAEITRLGLAMGAKAETFSGLSGIGDLIVTCLSQHSRNRYVGEAIGKGKLLNDVLIELDMVAEGIKTTESAHDLMKMHEVDMPISKAVYDILFKDKNPKKAVVDLMTRDLIRENIS